MKGARPKEHRDEGPLSVLSERSESPDLSERTMR